MAKVKLRRPLVLPLKVPGGKAEQASEIDLDFDKLTGADVLAAERVMVGKSGPSTVRFLSADFQLAIAERASGIDSETLQTLSAADFVELLAQVQLFFMPAVSEETGSDQATSSANSSST